MPPRATCPSVSNPRANPTGQSRPDRAPAASPGRSPPPIASISSSTSPDRLGGGKTGPGERLAQPRRVKPPPQQLVAADRGVHKWPDLTRPPRRPPRLQGGTPRRSACGPRAPWRWTSRPGRRRACRSGPGGRRAVRPPQPAGAPNTPSRVTAPRPDRDRIIRPAGSRAASAAAAARNSPQGKPPAFRRFPRGPQGTQAAVSRDRIPRPRYARRPEQPRGRCRSGSAGSCRWQLVLMCVARHDTIH